MGRWSQRRKRGGGVPLVNFMTAIQFVDNFNTLATYQYPIAANSLSPAAFLSDPSGAGTSLITQVDQRTVNIVWDDTTAGDTTVTYSGTTPQVQSPQVILF